MSDPSKPAPVKPGVRHPTPDEPQQKRFRPPTHPPQEPPYREPLPSYPDEMEIIPPSAGMTRFHRRLSPPLGIRAPAGFAGLGTEIICDDD